MTQPVTQKDSESKIIPARAVSRDFKKREIESEARLQAPQETQPAEVAESQNLTHRREFFRAVIPATGKLLTTFLREMGTAVGQLSEEAKEPTKEMSKKNSD